MRSASPANMPHESSPHKPSNSLFTAEAQRPQRNMGEISFGELCFFLPTAFAQTLHYTGTLCGLCVSAVNDFD